LSKAGFVNGSVAEYFLKSRKVHGEKERRLVYDGARTAVAAQVAAVAQVTAAA